MMTPDDVAEVVLFALTRPRNHAAADHDVPAHERGDLRMSAPVLRWGLLSTARINDALLNADPAKQERWVAVGSRDQAEGRGLRGREGAGARARLLRGAARRPRRRRGLHRAAQRHARRVDDEGARGGQARARREALLLRPRGGRGVLRPGRGARARPGRGVHVAPPPAGAAGAGAHRGGRDRRAARRCRRTSPSRSRTPTTCAGCARSTAGRSWTSGATASRAAGRCRAASRSGSRGSASPGATASTRRSPPSCASRATCWRRITCSFDAVKHHELDRHGDHGPPAPARPVARQPPRRWRSPTPTAPSRSTSARAPWAPTRSSSTTSRPPSRASGPPASGATTRSARPAPSHALYASAASHEGVAP